MKGAEPDLRVGVISGVQQLKFSLKNSFKHKQGYSFAPGSYRLYLHGGGIIVEKDGESSPVYSGEEFELEPESAESAFTLGDVVIGIGFHWERSEDQTFPGALVVVRASTGGLAVINRVGMERYLTSVISSEMSETAPAQLLRAHAVVSRSWLLAQLPPWRAMMPPSPSPSINDAEQVRWYDRENHADFDVCADDHCQRYQGMTKAVTSAAASATAETSGLVLSYDGRPCDARYSKSCGGVTERFNAAWADVDVPYLPVRYDGLDWPPEYTYPPKSEAAAARWILGRPEAFCSPPGTDVLSRILPGFDQETGDYYRWSQYLSQDELCDLLDRKLGLDLGRILSLEAVERGDSGRIIRLRLTGERRSVVIGKELEIRRALSRSHLYSSAFVVETDAGGAGIPRGFTLRGAGWGHGVGLCQIGAAVMAENGYDYARILRHYFDGANLERLY